MFGPLVRIDMPFTIRCTCGAADQTSRPVPDVPFQIEFRSDRRWHFPVLTSICLLSLAVPLPCHVMSSIVVMGTRIRNPLSLLSAASSRRGGSTCSSGHKGPKAGSWSRRLWGIYTRGQLPSAKLHSIPATESTRNNEIEE